MNINQIRTIGRQILESLYFIYENQLNYGHLHSGNLLFDYEHTFTIQLFDITNILAGVSAKYRSYYATLKHIHVGFFFIIEKRKIRCFIIVFTSRHSSRRIFMRLHDSCTSFQQEKNAQ